MLGLVQGNPDHKVFSGIDNVSESIRIATCGSVALEILSADLVVPDHGQHLTLGRVDKQCFNVTLWTVVFGNKRW